MKYAILRSGNKQYKVSKDSIITVERLKSKIGGQILFDDVLLYVGDGKSLKIGKPNTSACFSYDVRTVMANCWKYAEP